VQSCTLGRTAPLQPLNPRKAQSHADKQPLTHSPNERIQRKNPVQPHTDVRPSIAELGACSVTVTQGHRHPKGTKLQRLQSGKQSHLCRVTRGGHAHPASPRHSPQRTGRSVAHGPKSHTVSHTRPGTQAEGLDLPRVTDLGTSDSRSRSIRSLSRTQGPCTADPGQRSLSRSVPRCLRSRAAKAGWHRGVPGTPPPGPGPGPDPAARAHLAVAGRGGRGAGRGRALQGHQGHGCGAAHGRRRGLELQLPPPPPGRARGLQEPRAGGRAEPGRARPSP
jgi:hypothetical protein